MKISATHYRTGKTVEFQFEGGRLVSAVPSRSKTNLKYGPGLFDIQCNGFAGVDFNDPRLQAEEFRIAIQAAWRYGTTHLMPTLITAPASRMRHEMAAIAASLQKLPEIRPCIPGIHMEGPYLSKEEGFRGAHPALSILSPSLRHFDSMQKAASGLIRMLTLAPETPGALRIIHALSRKQMVVAIGHTAASPCDIAEAVQAGARISTHLGNGTKQLLPRHHNPMLAQLGEDRLFASLIPDGHHLPPFVLKSFIRAKPPGKVILTTDSMSGAAAPPGRYTIGHLLIEVGRDGIARQPGKPNFAGSTLTMNECVANAVRLANISLPEAWDMASIHPWKLMRRASLVRMPKLNNTFILARHENGSFTVQATVINRRLVHAK